MNMLPDAVMAERRALINAATEASRAYREALAPHTDGMGLAGNNALEEKAAWIEAEMRLKEFYVKYPMSKYRTQFNAESRAYRGR